MPPVEAATMIVIPTLATNAWQFMTGPNPVAVTARFAILLIGVAIGTALGVGFLTGSHTALVSLALGGVLILYAVVGLLSTRLHVPPQAERWMSPVIGVATGIVNGATGVSVMPLVPYLTSLGLQREALIQAMGLVFMIAMLSLAVCLAWTGSLSARVRRRIDTGVAARVRGHVHRSARPRAPARARRIASGSSSVSSGSVRTR